MSSFFRVLTIAGSDSGGGAGIQADLKTFAALECFGMSAVTALTAQNTVEVRSVCPVPPEFVSAQIETVLEDIGADAVKIGMLHSIEVIQAVVASLKKYPIDKIVVDPVMVAKGGSPLIQTDAVNSLKELLFPMASLITPNLPEAEILTGVNVEGTAEMEDAATRLLGWCPRVLIKGGHLMNSSVSSDLFATREGERRWLHYPRIPTLNTHGTGCTLSSAIAAYAARGLDWTQSIVKAGDFLHAAIVAGSRRSLGQGQGPVDHAWNTRERTSYFGSVFPLSQG